MFVFPFYHSMCGCYHSMLYRKGLGSICGETENTTFKNYKQKGAQIGGRISAGSVGYFIIQEKFSWFVLAQGSSVSVWDVGRLPGDHC